MFHHRSHITLRTSSIEKHRSEDEQAAKSSAQLIDFLTDSTVPADLKSLIESCASKMIDQNELFSQDRILLTGCTGYIGIILSLHVHSLELLIDR